MMNTIVKTVVLIGVLSALFFVNGCATGREAMTPDQQEVSLKLAAEQYWNARINGKYEITYALEGKEGLPADFTEYKLKASSMMKLNPQNVSISKITVDGGQGLVTVKFMLRMPDIAKPIPKFFQDEWVHQEGKWLHRFGD